MTTLNEVSKEAPKPVDLAYYKEVASRYDKHVKDGDTLAAMNLGCWLGERTHLLVTEIGRLRTEVERLQDIAWESAEMLDRD